MFNTFKAMLNVISLSFPEKQLFRYDSLLCKGALRIIIQCHKSALIDITNCLTANLQICINSHQTKKQILLHSDVFMQNYVSFLTEKHP